MNTTLAPAARRVALPALAAGALALGLALGPLAAFASTGDEEVDAAPAMTLETLAEQPVEIDVEGLQLPTLDVAAPEAPIDEVVAPAAPAPVTASGPSAEFTASTGRFIGTVTDTSGTPVVPSYVQVHDGSNLLEFVEVDASGAYATGELGAGSYYVAFIAPGRLPVTVTRDIVAGEDLELDAQLPAFQPLTVDVRDEHGTPAAGYLAVLHWTDGDGSAELPWTLDVDGRAYDQLWSVDYTLEIQTPQGHSLGWYDGDGTLGLTPLVIPGVGDGPALLIEIVLPLTIEVEPENPEEPGDPIQCTHPLDGLPIPCDVRHDDLCKNPLTGQWERCDAEECVNPLTGLPIECPDPGTDPDCEYQCEEHECEHDCDPDQPDLSTVPQYPSTETELETLALTGANWQGAAVIAGAFLLLGAAVRVTLLLQRRRESR